jgi:hypothetical protein
MSLMKCYYIYEHTRVLQIFKIVLLNLFFMFCKHVFIILNSGWGSTTDQTGLLSSGLRAVTMNGLSQDDCINRGISVSLSLN